MTYDQILARMILALEENDIGRFIELSYQIEIPPLSTPLSQQLPSATQSTITTTTTTTVVSDSTQTTPNATRSSIPYSLSPLIKDSISLEDDTKLETTGEDCKFIPQ